jgi:hypothetical protein
MLHIAFLAFQNALGMIHQAIGRFVKEWDALVHRLFLETVTHVEVTASPWERFRYGNAKGMKHCNTRRDKILEFRNF